MSRGPGRCQRRIIALLEGVPERRLNRAVLEEILVADEGYYSSNLLRSIRGLHRTKLVILRDKRRKTEAIVCLPREVKHITDDELGHLLAEIGRRK
jgi:hypothetical protein